MVDLVQEHAAEQLVALDHDLVAVEVEALHRHDLRPHDLERETRQREAALLVAPLAGRLDDLGVEHHVGAGVVVDVVDEEALLHADLRCGETDAGRVVHRVVHRVDELGQRAVDLVYRRRRPLEHGVAEEPDGVSRHRVIVVNRRSRSGRRRRSDACGVDHGSDAADRPARGVTDRERVGESVGVGRDDQRVAVGRPEHLDRIDAARARRIAAFTAASSPVSSASAPNGGKPSARRRSSSASATSAGRPLDERADDLVVGLAGLHDEAGLVAGAADEQLRAAGREPVRLRDRAVARREQLLVEVEEGDERRAGGAGPRAGAAPPRCR